MEKIVNYSVDNVTVYKDRARMTCKGMLQVDAGSHKLIFDELPLTLDSESVQVGGGGTAQVRIVGVDVSRRHYELAPAQRVRELEAQIEQIVDEIQVLDDNQTGLEAQIEHLQGLRQATREFARGLSRGRTSVEDQSRLMLFLSEQDDKLRAAMRETYQKRRGLDRHLSKLQAELNDLRSARPRQRFQARIEVEVLNSGEFGPELTYMVRAAGWQPLYDLRLIEMDEGQVLEVNTFAQVTQRTGQDWSNVHLSVSTARPALNRRLPELKPWYVDEYLVPLPRAQRSRSAELEPAMAAMAAPLQEAVPYDDAALDYVEADVAVAEVREGESTVTFDVAGQWDIPSDGSPNKMMLAKFRLDPKINYLAIPRHTDAVYRRATVFNKGSGPMLEGDASLFVGDEFIGKSRVEYTPIDGELELLLGVEERIRIERELTKRAVDKRLLRENRLLRYGYKIELKNLMASVVEVEVQDQIPVSRHEQIKVKLEQVSPEPAERSDLNIMEWQLSIKPETEANIQYEYLIEHPRTLKVTGLTE